MIFDPVCTKQQLMKKEAMKFGKEQGWGYMGGFSGASQPS